LAIEMKPEIVSGVHTVRSGSELRACRCCANIPANAHRLTCATQKQQLREVFIKYCAWGDKQNFMFISRAQFIRFVRDMNMCNEDIDALGLSGLFDKVCRCW
jgi:hypothetical protein